MATEFLRIITDHLQNNAGLSPAAATVGISDPVTAAELPAIVLSLARIRQLGKGLGERSQLVTGALSWTATIDLANPVLPEEPSFRLLSQDRKELVLPHGGLVRSDGSDGSLTATDVSINVDGTPRPLVASNPTGNQVVVDPLVGRLIFATALPPGGSLNASYFLGQWEQRVSRIAGLLRVTVRDTNPATVSDLSGAVANALQPPSALAIADIKQMDLMKLGSIGAPEEGLAKSRARDLLFSFEFERKINRPESSGGIIQRIPITANFDAPTIVA